MVKHVHQDELDRYYTLPGVAGDCLSLLDLTGFEHIVEPSAGDGAFSNQIAHPGLVALDIKPAAAEIIECDYLAWSPPLGKTLVVGNPPYGVNNKMISAFIKKSCSFADTVAFILPLSYKKESMHARWPRIFHLVSEMELPTPNATLFGDLVVTRNVFQVWKRGDIKRPIPVLPAPIGWAKVKPEEADAAIRTHGVGLGRISDPAVANKSSHLFVKFDGPVDQDALHAYLFSHPWPDLNMGQPSIGSRDYVPVINAFIAQQS